MQLRVRLQVALERGRDVRDVRVRERERRGGLWGASSAVLLYALAAAAGAPETALHVRD